jgi:ArsR family transcriptional regulator
MPSTLKQLRAAADPTRARLLLLLSSEELSVAELQEILGIGQSTVSTHLSQLKAAGLIADRRSGKNTLYRLKAANGVIDLLRAAAASEILEAEKDAQALALALERRKDRVRSYFDELAGRFGREYVPGRSWQGYAELFLELAPPLEIADLGAGEGTLAQLLARRAKRVIAVDNSAKMVDFGRELAHRHGVSNLEYRHGDLEALPLCDAEVDLAVFSQSLHHAQHPDLALAEAGRVLRPEGRVLVLDLLEHHLEEARELYADTWLGFSEVQLRTWLAKAGFSDVRTHVVHREQQAPHFETVLAVGAKRR